MMLKYFLNYFLFTFTMFAAGAPAVGGQGGSPTGAPGGAGAGSGGASSGGGATGAGQPTGDGSQQSGGGTGAGAGAGQGTDGIRQLREAYDKIKADYEPFQNLNLKADQISQYSGVYQKLSTEVTALGRELGFTDQDIAEALTENPVATLDFLRNKAQEMSQQGGQDQGGDLRQQMEEMVGQVMGPIQQRENNRMTSEANSLFERTVHQEVVNLFKGQGIDAAQIPQDEMEFLMSATSEIMKYEEADLLALKYEGKTAGVQKAFQEAVKFADKYYLARSGRERARMGPPNRGGNQPGQQQNGNQGRKPTLDEIINGEASAVAAMPSMRG